MRQRGWQGAGQAGGFSKIGRFSRPLQPFFPMLFSFQISHRLRASRSLLLFHVVSLTRYSRTRSYTSCGVPLPPHRVVFLPLLLPHLLRLLVPLFRPSVRTLRRPPPPPPSPPDSGASSPHPRPLTSLPYSSVFDSFIVSLHVALKCALFIALCLPLQCVASVASCFSLRVFARPLPVCFNASPLPPRRPEVQYLYSLCMCTRTLLTRFLVAFLAYPIFGCPCLSLSTVCVSYT